MEQKKTKEKCNGNACQYKRTHMYTTAWSCEEVNATKFMHKFRAATFECNAGQYEIKATKKNTNNVKTEWKLPRFYGKPNFFFLFLFFFR